MLHMYGALLFLICIPVQAGHEDENDDGVAIADKVKAYLKTRSDLIVRERPITLREIQGIDLSHVKHITITVADPEELPAIAGHLIRSPQLKAVLIVEGALDSTLKRLVEIQDNRQQIQLQCCELKPSKLKTFPTLSIEKAAPTGDRPQSLFEYVNLETQLGKEVAEKARMIKAKSDSLLRKAREDAWSEIALVGSGCWREMTIESLKGRVLAIYDRYLVSPSDPQK